MKLKMIFKNMLLNMVVFLVCLNFTYSAIIFDGDVADPGNCPDVCYPFQYAESLKISDQSCDPANDLGGGACDGRGENSDCTGSEKCCVNNMKTGGQWLCGNQLCYNSGPCKDQSSHCAGESYQDDCGNWCTGTKSCCDPNQGNACGPGGCGVIQCDGSCSVTENNYGEVCSGYCGYENCGGSCLGTSECSICTTELIRNQRCDESLGKLESKYIKHNWYAETGDGTNNCDTDCENECADFCSGIANKYGEDVCCYTTYETGAACQINTGLNHCVACKASRENGYTSMSDGTYRQAWHCEGCTNNIKRGVKTSGTQHISWNDNSADTACCVNSGDCVVGNTCRSFNYYHTGLNSGGDDNIARCGSSTYWRDVDESSSRCTGAGLDFIPAGDSANVGEYGSSANGGDGTTECCGDDADEYEIDSYCCDDSSDCVDDDDDDGDEDCINTNTAYSDDGGALSNMHCSNTNTNPCKDSGDICTTSGSYTCKMDSFNGELEWHLTSADDVREYCNDGIDNDCDGNIDADDTECRLLTGTVYQEISPDLEPEAGDIPYGNRYYELSAGATIVVRMSDGDDSIYGGDVTDENGEYSVNLSASEDYYVAANKSGYQSVDPKYVSNAVSNIVENFYLPIGMGCTDACYRYDVDGNAVCDASCDGVAGCVFNNSYISENGRMIKEICDGQLSGMVFGFNTTHEVKCCGSIRRFLDACEEDGSCPNGGNGNKRVIPWWGVPYNKSSIYGTGGRPEFVVRSESQVEDVVSYSRIVNLNGELVTMYISVWQDDDLE